MRLPSQKYWMFFLILLALIDITYSRGNDTVTEGRRSGRVSGRIVKLYSGPKPDPVICLGEGFQKDTVDCSVFYRCLKATNGKYTVYRFQCGPGTVYDPETEVCNHPRSTKRLECGGLAYDKLISSTEKYIENEIEGVQKENQELPSPITTKSPLEINAVAETSKPDKLFNSYLSTSYPWITSSSQVYAETSKTTTATPSHVPTSTSTKNPKDYTSLYTTSYPIIQPNPRDNQCTSDGFMGDNEDCRKFYRCVNNQRGGFIRYEFSCSESTIWDDDTKGCNHAWAVQRRRCGKGNSLHQDGISYGNKNPSNEFVFNHTIQQQAVSQSQVQNSNEPGRHPAQINYGDRLNQQESIIKQNQTQIAYDNVIQNQMQFNYGDEVIQSEQQVDHTTRSSQAPSSSTTITTTTQYMKDTRNNKCTKDGLIGDSNDCSKFYRCISNGKGGYSRYDYSCSEGTLWDEKLEACNHAWAVKECGAKISSEKPSPIATTIAGSSQSYYTTTLSTLNNEIEDEIGYGSQNNNKPDQEEPKPTHTFSTSTTTTESLKMHESNCRSGGFFGNVDDCAKFYRCVENGRGGYTKYEYKCGDGTVWDPEIESCNHAWAVKNCNSQKGSINLQTSTENVIITTVSLVHTTTQKNLYDTEYNSGYGSDQRETSPPPASSTERISHQDSVCKTAGFMGDDKDCKKFYRCVENGKGQYYKYEFTCGEGTVWDPKIDACNHAWAVEKCGGSKKDQDQITTAHTVPQDDSDIDNGYTLPQDMSKGPELHPESTTLTTTINKVSSDPSKGKECQSNGFMGDDNDCKIFYRCVENGNRGFIRYEFSCGDGTVWDPKISACNHAWAVEKCGGNTSPSKQDSGSTASIDTETSTKITTQYTTLSSSSSLTSTTLNGNNNPCVTSGFVGDKYDCKKFYRCVDDGKGNFLRYEFSCGEGTVWDPKLESCNHVWAVDSCRDYASAVSMENSTTSHPITMKDDTDDNYTTQYTPEASSSTTNNYLNSSTVATSAPLGDNECKSEGFMADNQDCKKFYRCVNDGKGTFIRYEFSCGEGTVWDSEINSCNHISSVKTPCSVTTQTTEASRGNDTSVITTEKNIDSSSSSTPQKSQQCDKEGFFGDKNNCKKFYRCTDNGQGGYNKYEFSCGDGTVWDQNILACNHPPSDGNCITTETETHEESSESSVSTSTSINLSESTEKPDFAKDQCTSEGFYANSNDCKKFFRCVGNGKGGFTKYDFTCGDGTVWVQDIQACDHDSDKSHCSKDTITTTTQSSQEQPVATSTSSTTLTTSSTSNPHSSTSADEYNTESSNKPETSSESSSTTQASSTGSTSSNTMNQDTCEESGYFGNSKDCKKFYRCVDNGKGGYTKYDYTCAEGTIWDQDITACNHPQDVSHPSCEKEDSQSTTTTASGNVQSSETTTKSSSTSTTAQSTNAEGNNQNPQEGSTNNPNKNNYTCTEAGFYPDPYDCKKFYRCVDWDGDRKSFSIFHFDCAEGTIWDPELQTCNHEDSVYPPRDCSGTQSQSETNGTATSQGTTSKQEETTESATTEGTTSSAQSTTQKSTSTTDQTSTQQSSTTDQTSTQQSSTTDQTSTTQKSTTGQTSTTQKSTTEQSTTQTEKSTSQQPTTEQSTTQQSSTEQSTTQQSSTEQSTTQQSTTEHSTTQQSTAEQSTTQQSTTEQSTTQQSTTEQSTTQQTTSSSEKTTEQSTTSSTTEQSTSTTEEATSTTTKSTTSETSTGSAEQTTTADQTTTQESNTEQTTENQSSTTEQSTTTQESSEGSSTTESGQDTTTEKESADKECPDTDDDQYLYVCPTGFRRHPKYCNLFYQCTEDTDSHEVKVAVFNCPNNTIYDESKIQCVEEEKAGKKCNGQIAEKRRVKRLDKNYKEPISVNRQNYSCPTAGHFPFEKNEECSPVLFKCEATKTGKLRGLVYQCPEGYVYWSISRRCEPVNAMKDCKRSYLDWSGRYEIPIERKNVARKI